MASRVQGPLAVYSPKPGITTAALARLAAEAGWAIRFLALGVYIDRDTYRGSDERLAQPQAACLVCGWPEPGGDAAAAQAFDAACQAGDRNAVGLMAKEGRVAWFELYTRKYDHTREYRNQARYQAKVEAAASPEERKAMQAARTRYVFHNQGRRKASGELMAAVAHALAPAVDGTVVNHIRPT